MKLNTIWLSENEETTFQGKIVIEDSRKYDKIIQNLEDANYFIKDLEKNYNYKNKGKLINPRRMVQDLLEGKSEGYFDLVDLFETLEVRDEWKTRYQEMKMAKAIIESLKESSMGIDLKKHIINKMWPSFGFFATECLDFIGIEEGTKYNIQELENIKEMCKKNDVECSDEVRDLLIQVPRAICNGKVLELARNANAVSK